VFEAAFKLLFGMFNYVSDIVGDDVSTRYVGNVAFVITYLFFVFKGVDPAFYFVEG